MKKVEFVKVEDNIGKLLVSEKELKELVAHKKYFFMVKRVIDILGSIIGLVLLIPITIIVGGALKLEDWRAPIFFVQERVGKNQKIFHMFKFRSMEVDAEDKLESLLPFNEVEGAMFKMKNDPRVTKVGKFIRKTSIDELPQFINVLLGDMSLVGPRPPLMREVEKYDEVALNRLLIKPGCTGLWQISGRNEVGFRDMLDLDLDYIGHLSLKNDLKILFKTIKIIILPNGAY